MARSSQPIAVGAPPDLTPFVTGQTDQAQGFKWGDDKLAQLLMGLALLDSGRPRVNPPSAMETIAPLAQMLSARSNQKQAMDFSKSVIANAPSATDLVGGGAPASPDISAYTGTPGQATQPNVSMSASAPPLSTGGAISDRGAGERVASTLRARGWSDAAIEGALNNSITESSLNPTATGAAGEKGLFQLHPKSHIGPFTQSYGGNWSPEAQASYIADTIDRSMPSYKLASDGRAATADFMLGFERPKDQSASAIAARAANGEASRAILGRIGGGQQPDTVMQQPRVAGMQLASATPPTMNDASPAPATARPLLVGDSIAGHMVTFGGGQGTTDRTTVGQYKPGLTAVNGFTPSNILETVIPGIPDEKIRGRPVILSTGASNDPTQLQVIPQQIAALKQRGASAVTLAGVGTAPQLQGVNDTLAKIAADNGATFAGPLRSVGGDGIHSTDPKGELAVAQAAIPAAPTPVITPRQAVVQTYAQGGLPDVSQQQMGQAHAAMPSTMPPRSPETVSGPRTQAAAAAKSFDYWGKAAMGAGFLGTGGAGMLEYAKAQMALASKFMEPTELEKNISKLPPELQDRARYVNAFKGSPELEGQVAAAQAMGKLGPDLYKAEQEKQLNQRYDPTTAAMTTGANKQAELQTLPQFKAVDVAGNIQQALGTPTGAMKEAKVYETGTPAEITALEKAQSGSRPTTTINNVTNPIAAGIGETFKDQHKSATAAVDTIAAIHAARGELDKGIISGVGAVPEQYLARVGELFGIPSEQVANTAAFKSAIGTVTLSLAKQLGSGNGITNADRDFAERMAGGSEELGVNSIRHILDIREKSERYKINRFSTQAERLLGGANTPDALKEIAPLLRVEEPAPYRPAPAKVTATSDPHGDGTIATNPATGQSLIKRNGAWEKLP